MPTIPARSAVDLPPGVAPAAVVWDEVVAAGGYTHKVLGRGAELRFLDPAGDACAGLLLLNADEPWERLNVADTVKVQWQAYLGPDQLLLSDQGRVLATIVEDTSGCHDALCGASTRAANVARYGDGAPEGPSPAARDLFLLALAKHGLDARDLPPTISLFKGALVEPDGALVFQPGAGPAAHVTLRTELPLLVVVVNVPHPLDPREDYTVSSLRLTAWQAVPTTSEDRRWTSSPEAERAYLNTADHLEARSA